MANIFKVADIKELEEQVTTGAISYSRMVEILNEMASHPQEVEAGEDKIFCPDCKGDGFITHGRYGDDDYKEEDCEKCGTSGQVFAGYKAKPLPVPAAVEEGKESVVNGQCNHEWVGYSQCCYCGAYDNGKKIIEECSQHNVESLRQSFNEWYMGVKETNGGYPPLAMQIFFWFDKNLRIFETLSSKPPLPSSSITEGKEVDAEKLLDAIIEQDKDKMLLAESEKELSHNGIKYMMVRKELAIQAINEIISGYTSVPKEENKNY